jgi:hypothetical protein
MSKLASESGKDVQDRPGGGRKSAKNAKKILNRGNEPKDLLKTKELASSGAENELFFECNKGQSKQRIGPEMREFGGIEWNEKLEIRNWKMEIGNYGGQFPVSAFWFLSFVAHPAGPVVS